MGAALDLYLSRFTNRLDAKGRVSIPASFRAVLARDGFEGLYVYPSLEEQAVDCGGNTLLNEIQTLLAPFSKGSVAWGAFAATLYGESEILKLDGEGRVVVPDGIKTHTGITSGSHLRRHGSQVSTLGAQSIPCVSGRGQRPVTRSTDAIGTSRCGGGQAVFRGTGMMEGGDGPRIPVAGGPSRHLPVLRPEAIAALRLRDGGLYLDGTFGAGGYSRAMLAGSGTTVIGLDRDPTAAAAAQAVAAEFPERLIFRQARFGTLDSVVADLGRGALDGIVLDIGVSSMQLDQAERGFSFRTDGPLDMRMERDGPTAADIVNTADETTLAAILYRYGEERESRRIARAIVADRTATPFLRTRPLAELVARVVRGAPKGVHPATKTFQALRIAVNDELGELLAALSAAERVLAPDGSLAVVTFHSLEDRIVKRFLTRAAGRGATGSRHLPPTGDGRLPSFSLPPGQPVRPR